MGFGHELHVHLFGCLTAADIYELGKSRAGVKEELLQWYAHEYEKAWGRRPQLDLYWGDDGVEAIAEDFLFRRKEPFAKFQACFNLLIALFKITARDTEVLRHVLGQDRRRGMSYVEYRTIIPSHFDAETMHTYFRHQAEVILEEATEAFVPKLVFTLMRDNRVCEQQYTVLREWMDSHPGLAKAIVGIDFSYFEEGYPPGEKKDFFARVHGDNNSREDRLAILYHVGESFEQVPMDVSARWVYEASAYGAHRLGHALSLGVDPTEYRGRKWKVSPQMMDTHTRWLHEQREVLAQHGYKVSGNRTRIEGGFIEADDRFIEECRQFQSALISMLKDKQHVIECCPTSNEMIGQLSSLRAHPLKRFVENGLNVVIASDDPGVFDTTLDQEFLRVEQEIKLSSEEVSQIKEQTLGFKCSDLV